MPTRLAPSRARSVDVPDPTLPGPCRAGRSVARAGRRSRPRSRPGGRPRAWPGCARRGRRPSCGRCPARSAISALVRPSAMQPGDLELARRQGRPGSGSPPRPAMRDRPPRRRPAMAGAPSASAARSRASPASRSRLAPLVGAGVDAGQVDAWPRSPPRRAARSRQPPAAARSDVRALPVEPSASSTRPRACSTAGSVPGIPRASTTGADGVEPAACLMRVVGRQVRPHAGHEQRGQVGGIRRRRSDAAAPASTEPTAAARVATGQGDLGKSPQRRRQALELVHPRPSVARLVEGAVRGIEPAAAEGHEARCTWRAVTRVVMPPRPSASDPSRDLVGLRPAPGRPVDVGEMGGHVVPVVPQLEASRPPRCRRAASARPRSYSTSTEAHDAQHPVGPACRRPPGRRPRRRRCRPRARPALAHPTTEHLADSPASMAASISVRAIADARREIAGLERMLDR